jgi:Golgi phosphoprotein 3
LLSLAEEILLLALDDEKGSFVPLPRDALEFALTSAALMDLALQGRIDSDLDQLVLVDATPLGDDILDPLLAAIARSDETYNAKRWISVVARDAEPIRERALERLVQRGILERKEQKLLWVLGQRRYPVVDATESREVKLRILEIVLSDEIPDLRDVVIIALADACQLFDSILSPRELRAARPRIAQVVKMDLIGQALVKALRDMRDWGRWAGGPREQVWGEQDSRSEPS